ncbi:MAG TPA: LolA-related protein [Stellaceae bacterium]|nr:LolA-related protein [Stellaceae bacterium]
MRRRVSLVIALIAGLGLHAPPSLAQSAPAFGLTQLMARFGAVKSATAQFTERKYLRMLKSPLSDSGVLIYAAPDKLEKNTLRPQPETLTIDGDTLAIEREGQTQTLSLSAYPQIGGFIEGIRATLAGDLATLQRIYYMQFAGSIDAWQLILQPRDAKMREIVRAIYISGDDVHITRIQTVEGDGDRTDMTITPGSP